MSVKSECEQYYQLEIKAEVAVFMRVTRRGKAHRLVHAVTSPDRMNPACLSV